MSPQKSDVLRTAGVHIAKQVELLEALVPQRAGVEISARRAVGYFTEALAGRPPIASSVRFRGKAAGGNCGPARGSH